MKGLWCEGIAIVGCLAAFAGAVAVELNLPHEDAVIIEQTTTTETTARRTTTETTTKKETTHEETTESVSSDPADTTDIGATEWTTVEVAETEGTEGTELVEPTEPEIYEAYTVYCDNYELFVRLVNAEGGYLGNYYVAWMIASTVANHADYYGLSISEAITYPGHYSAYSSGLVWSQGDNLNEVSYQAVDDVLAGSRDWNVFYFSDGDLHSGYAWIIDVAEGMYFYGR